MDFWICVGCLCFGILMGLSAAWYNLNNHAARQARLEARRAYRRNRKGKWVVPFIGSIPVDDKKKGPR